jgi:hypothetical protein
VHARHQRGALGALLEAPWNQDHALGAFAVDDGAEGHRHLGGRDAQHREVHPPRQRFQAGDAAAAVDRGAARLDHPNRLGVEPGAQGVLQDDPAGVHPLRDADDGDRLRLEESVELLDRTRRRDGRGLAEREQNVQGDQPPAAHHQWVDLELADRSRAQRLGHLEEDANHARQDLEVQLRRATALSLGHETKRGRCHEPAPELGVVEIGGQHRVSLTGRKGAGKELGVDAAGPHAHHRPEGIGPAQPDQQLVSQGWLERHELAQHESFERKRAQAVAHLGGRGQHVLAPVGHHSDGAGFGLVEQARRNRLEHDPVAGKRRRIPARQRVGAWELDPARHRDPESLEQCHALGLEQRAAPAMTRRVQSAQDAGTIQGHTGTFRPASNAARFTWSAHSPLRAKVRSIMASRLWMPTGSM